MGVEPAKGKRLIASKIWQVEHKTLIEFLYKHAIQGGSCVLKLQHVHPRLDGLHLVDQKISANVLAIHGLPRIPEFASSKREPTVSLCDAVISVEYMVDPSRIVYHILRVDPCDKTSTYASRDDGAREVSQDKHSVSEARLTSQNWTKLHNHQPRGYPDGGQHCREANFGLHEHRINPGMEKSQYKSRGKGPFSSACSDQGVENSWTCTNSDQELSLDSEWGAFDLKQKYNEEKMASAGPPQESQGMSNINSNLPTISVYALPVACLASNICSFELCTRLPLLYYCIIL